MELDALRLNAAGKMPAATGWKPALPFLFALPRFLNLD